MTWRRRRVRVVAACVLQLLVVGVAVAPSLSARVLGEEYRLAVAPVDPIDPFRGAYVALDDPGLREAVSGIDIEDDVFVPLEADGDLWVGGRTQASVPASGPYLRCASEGWRVRCGIESFFASQGRARQLERELADGAVAVIRIDGRGNAAVVAIEPGG